jgi:tetratricopeptide (TPR) repeat protein
VDRDAKIEQLLLAGLDHYFASQYDQAINVWSRALFLDRGHARARAYIERARSALAERQRQSEELLQQGLTAFQQGDADGARRLLERALQQGAPSEEALSVLERLNRLELPATPPVPGRPRDRTPRDPSVPVPAPHRSSGGRLAKWAVLGFAVATAAALAEIVRGSEWPAVLPLQPIPPPSLRPPAAAGTNLPIPLRGESALARARALAASGHLREALVALDLVRPTDPQRGDADRLRGELQRQLIALESRNGLLP